MGLSYPCIKMRVSMTRIVLFFLFSISLFAISGYRLLGQPERLYLEGFFSSNSGHPESTLTEDPHHVHAIIAGAAARFSGLARTLSDPFYGLNTKNIGDWNFMADINVLETGWKKIGASIYRYPGGTFGNSFDWHTGTTVVGGRPPEVNPPVKPADVAEKIPEDTDILWMANVRIPLPSTGYDWRTLTRAELLSQDVLQAKIADLIDGLRVFRNAGRPVKYLELGNEFYFSDEEGFGEIHGAGGDNPASDFQGDHFPYDKNPDDYIAHMAAIAKAVKAEFPDIRIAVMKQKMESGNQANWNSRIDVAFALNNDIREYVDAVTIHWYQPEKWYPGQNGDLPPITGISSCKTALGLAYDYIEFKKQYDLANAPSGKEVWITEGDIKDPSVENTWLEAVREAILEVNYVLMDQVIMYTPQIFQPLYIDSDRLDLTTKGKGAQLVFAAGKGMNRVEEIDAGGGSFTSVYGGPYPDLQAVRFSDGHSERFLLINASDKSYSGIDLSAVAESAQLVMLQRYNPTPWNGGSCTEQKSTPDLAAISLQPYSVAILAGGSLIDDLIEPDLSVVDPDSRFPDHKLSLFEFGERDPYGQYSAVLKIRNDGNTPLTLAEQPVSLNEGQFFSIIQPEMLVIPPGQTSAFTVVFSPPGESDYLDEAKVRTHDGQEYTFRISGRACAFCNGDFEKGHDVGWTLSHNPEIAAIYSQASILHTAFGEVSGQVEVGPMPGQSFPDVTLNTPLIKLDPSFSALKIEFEARAESFLSGDFRISVRFFDENDQLTGAFVSAPFSPADTYAIFEYTSPAIPQQATQYQVSMECGQYPAGYFFDNLIVTEGTLQSREDEPTVRDPFAYFHQGKLCLEAGPISGTVDILVYNLAGICLYRQYGVPADQGISFPTDSWPAGMYAVILQPVERASSGMVMKVMKGME